MNSDRLLRRRRRRGGAGLDPRGRKEEVPRESTWMI